MKYLNAEELNKLPAKPLKENETFTFSCHSKLECFNLCCRNLKLFLYPYDVIRLKQNLNISSDLFIDQHTDIIIRPADCFPDVLLTMAENQNKTCPFLTETGCSVYKDRSYSCRTYPMEQGALYQENDKPKPIYFFRPPGFCRGKNETERWNPQTWIENQKAETYNKMTIKWSEIKSLFAAAPPWTNENSNNPKLKAAFMAAYNIDKFREFVFSSTFLKRYKIKPELKRKIKTDDQTLLTLSFAWIKLHLWNIKSNLIR